MRWGSLRRSWHRAQTRRPVGSARSRWYLLALMVSRPSTGSRFGCRRGCSASLERDALSGTGAGGKGVWAGKPGWSFDRGVGAGTEPVVLGGEVFLTGGYDGAPFGRLVRTHALAGPFDLGYVNVRSRINVNPNGGGHGRHRPGPARGRVDHDAQGHPGALKRLRVTVDRPDLEFNPTSCDPMSITGVLSGAEGASAPVSSRFQVGGCESLPFHPGLTATVGGHANKANGTGFNVTVTSQGLGVANVKKVELQIPAQLPSRQSHAQPGLPRRDLPGEPRLLEGSVIGAATVHTPVLKSHYPYWRIWSRRQLAKFPDVEFVLQAKASPCSSTGTPTSKTASPTAASNRPGRTLHGLRTKSSRRPPRDPDPLRLRKEPYELCGSKHQMPTTITARTGAVIQPNTTVIPTGCNGTLATHTTKPTRAPTTRQSPQNLPHQMQTKKARRNTHRLRKTAREHYGPNPRRRPSRRPGKRQRAIMASRGRIPSRTQSPWSRRASRPFRALWRFRPDAFIDPLRRSAAATAAATPRTLEST